MNHIFAVVRSYFDAIKLQKLLPWNQYGYSLHVEYVAISSLAILKKSSPDILIIHDKLLHIDSESLISTAKKANSKISVIIIYDGKDVEPPETSSKDNIFFVCGFSSTQMASVLQNIKIGPKKNIQETLLLKKDLDELIKKIKTPKGNFRILYFLGEFVSDVLAGKFINDTYKKYCIGWYREKDGSIIILYSDIESTSTFYSEKKLQELIYDTDANLSLYEASRHVFISDSVPLSKISEEYDSILEMKKYSYFNSEHKLLTWEYIRDKEKIPVGKDMSVNFDFLFIAVISADRLSVIREIEEIYFNHVNKSMNFKCLLICRGQLEACFRRICNIAVNNFCTDLFKGYDFTTVENECDYVGKKFIELLSHLKSKKIRDIVVKSLYIVKNKYCERISLIDAAEELNVSDTYLSRVFKEDMSMNFIDYLNRYRISKAKELMSNGVTNIGEISNSTGFWDAKYFSRVFKKISGESPSAYIKSNYKESHE